MSTPHPTNARWSTEAHLDARVLSFSHDPAPGVRRTLRIASGPVLLLLGVLGLRTGLGLFFALALLGLVVQELLLVLVFWPQAVTLRLTPSHLRWEVGGREGSILLEDIVQIRGQQGLLWVESPTHRYTIVSSRDGARVEGLATLLQADVEQRRALLAGQGHDLSAPAPPPEALLRLTAPRR